MVRVCVEDASMAFIDGDKFVKKLFNRHLIRCTTACNNQDSPSLDWALVVVLGELLAIYRAVRLTSPLIHIAG